MHGHFTRRDDHGLAHLGISPRERYRKRLDEPPRFEPLLLTERVAEWFPACRGLHAMTHREFLLWLQPELQKAAAQGLGRDGVRAIRRELEQLQTFSTLQPFASRLFSLVCEHTTLDRKMVAGLVAEVHSELAPAREQTVVMSANPESEEK